MKPIIKDLNILISEDIRLVKTLYKREQPDEFPEEFKWKVQLLHFHHDRWIEICRLDNYLHEAKQGSHIHEYRKTSVIRENITFQNAESIVIRKGMRIIREKFQRGTQDAKKDLHS